MPDQSLGNDDPRERSVGRIRSPFRGQIRQRKSQIRRRPHLLNLPRSQHQNSQPPIPCSRCRNQLRRTRISIQLHRSWSLHRRSPRHQHERHAALRHAVPQLRVRHSRQPPAAIHAVAKPKINHLEPRRHRPGCLQHPAPSPTPKPFPSVLASPTPKPKPSSGTSKGAIGGAVV